MRKVSTMSGCHHGLIEARGPDLEIFAIDPAMRQVLLWCVCVCLCVCVSVSVCLCVCARDS